MKAEKVFEVVNIMSRCGYDVALAFPLTILGRVAEIIGMTQRVFMVDQNCRVWVHYPLLDSRIIEVFREAKEAILDKEEDEETPTTEDQSTQLRDHIEKARRILDGRVILVSGGDCHGCPLKECRFNRNSGNNRLTRPHDINELFDG